VDICVVGLGKLGLPLAVQFALKGHRVRGADIKQQTVELINQGIEPFPGEAHLDVLLPQVVKSGNLVATTQTTEAVASSEVVVVVVPLIVDNDANPDFTAMDAATSAVGRGLKSGTLVSFETTLPIGTTRNRLAPLLAKQSGLEPGTDFFVTFSPERVLTGRVFSDLRRYPKLVGGIDSSSESRGAEFYSSVLDFDERDDLSKPNGVWEMGSSEAAEFAKLAETTYRDVNIGLANQFAKHADKIGVDVYRVIEACNSQPYSHIHQPGIAVGGHCIPVYPRLYLHNDPDATIVRTSREANLSMPEYAVRRLEEEYGDLKDAKIAVLGVSYRGGVKETAFSGVFAVVHELTVRGADVRVHDPLYSDVEIERLGFTPLRPEDPADAVVIQADHDEYRNQSLTWVSSARVILDGRRVLSSGVAPNNVAYIGFRRGPGGSVHRSEITG